MTSFNIKQLAMLWLLIYIPSALLVHLNVFLRSHAKLFWEMKMISSNKGDPCVVDLFIWWYATGFKINLLVFGTMKVRSISKVLSFFMFWFLKAKEIKLVQIFILRAVPMISYHDWILKFLARAAGASFKPLLKEFVIKKL